MKIEEVNSAMVNGSIIKHTYMGTTCRYRLSGVITRYSPVRGWLYSLELQDLNSGCIVIASLVDCEVENDAEIH